ncbi:hypothetical protein JKA74_05595 [Marivirga sp. S37H4]|uniref:Uncharacterized protein n=1 Tax=Marivirga aurantiaca TaxID=2802615 RepID=A0A935C6Q7_9BACT|nr:hypothetical protein [Marivirga aurantiaca]MBK6264504.1 hypothetical protein [Marivirga aurantiaca]
MTEEEKKSLKLAIEKKIVELKKLIIELKEDTKPQGLDSAIGRVRRMDYIRVLLKNS